MPGKRIKQIKVWVQVFKDRKSLQLQWMDHKTGRRTTKSARTRSPAQAEIARARLERKLNQEAGTVGPAFCKPRSNGGFVYLIEGAKGVFKVGKSSRPEARVSDLQIASPGEFRLIHRIVTNNMAWLERVWHRKFAAQRIRGEWFALSDEDVGRFTCVTVWNHDSPPIQGALITDPWYS